MREHDLGQISKVEIFGEFSDNHKAGAWGIKIPCQQLQSDFLMYSAEVEIKLGQKFKFVIDGGRAYVTSAFYM